MKPFRLAALIVALALMATPALAQQAAGPAQGGASEQQQGSQQPGEEVRHVEGHIDSVDQYNHTIMIDGFGAFLATTLHVTPETKLKAAKGVPQPESFSSLVPGSKIRASYRKVDHHYVADEITVLEQGHGASNLPWGGPGGQTPSGGK